MYMPGRKMTTECSVHGKAIEHSRYNSPRLRSEGDTLLCRLRLISMATSGAADVCMQGVKRSAGFNGRGPENPGETFPPRINNNGPRV